MGSRVVAGLRFTCDLRRLTTYVGAVTNAELQDAIAELLASEKQHLLAGRVDAARRDRELITGLQAKLDERTRRN